VTTTKGKDWKEDPEAIMRREKTDAKRAEQGKRPLGTKVKKISNFFPNEGRCPPGQELEERSTMADSYNDNDVTSTAYTLLNGLKFF